MSKLDTALEERLKGLATSLSETDFATTGHHVEAEVAAAGIRAFAKELYDAEFYLVFVTAIHVEEGERVIYQFDHFENPCRIRVMAPAEEQAVPTISDIFTGADWHEREARDLLGVRFTDHPNLIPLILCEEDVDLMPLRKSEKTLKAMEAVTRGAKPKKKAAPKRKSE